MFVYSWVFIYRGVFVGGWWGVVVIVFEYEFDYGVGGFGGFGGFGGCCGCCGIRWVYCGLY